MVTHPAYGARDNNLDYDIAGNSLPNPLRLLTVNANNSNGPGAFSANLIPFIILNPGLSNPH